MLGGREQLLFKIMNAPSWRPFCLRLNVLSQTIQKQGHYHGFQCLRTPCIYLNQCLLNINKILWHSFQGNVYWNTQDINPRVAFEIHTFEITATSPRGRVKPHHEPSLLNNFSYHRNYHYDTTCAKQCNHRYACLQNTIRCLYNECSPIYHDISYRIEVMAQNLNQSLN